MRLFGSLRPIGHEALDESELSVRKMRLLDVLEFVTRIRSLSGRFVHELRLWAQVSKTRRHLAGLSDHSLEDLGLTRGDVQRESVRVFWDHNLRR